MARSLSPTKGASAGIYLPGSISLSPASARAAPFERGHATGISLIDPETKRVWTFAVNRATRPVIYALGALGHETRRCTRRPSGWSNNHPSTAAAEHGSAFPITCVAVAARSRDLPPLARSSHFLRSLRGKPPRALFATRALESPSR